VNQEETGRKGRIIKKYEGIKRSREKKEKFGEIGSDN